MTLLSAFYQQCKRQPEAIALIENDRRLTYQQLRHHSLQLSEKIIGRTDAEPRVIIAIDRGIDAVIAILAVLRTAGCYIPLDLKNPDSRLKFIVRDAEPHAVIGLGSCPVWLENPDLWLDMSQLPHAETATSGSDSKTVQPATLAAILYTSGSTGNPKGVALSQNAMQNFADWAAETFNINSSDKIASLAPFYFDLSVFDLYTSLSCGATINFIPNRLTFSPSRLTGWLAENQINVFYTVPSILSFIALKGALDSTQLTHLKTILFAGEVFPTPQLKTLCEKLPAVNFYNLYGPTETNVCCYWPVERNRLSVTETIPIGHAACDSELTIDQTSGELKVKSLNNLSGYWQNGQLTSVLSTDDYYPTGDKVSINEHGEYCYHGRLDRMMKCAGYRVEPAEIENTLLQNPEVANCAVIAIPDSTSGQRPAAVLVLKTGATLAEIVSSVKQQLPAYMQPCKYLLVDSLPYLTNGKIDYQFLQKQLEQP